MPETITIIRLIKLKYVLWSTAVFWEQLWTANTTLRCVTSHYFLGLSYIFCVLIHLVTQWKFHQEGFTFRNLKKKSRLMKNGCWSIQKCSQPSFLDIQLCINEEEKPGALSKHWLLCAAGLLAHPLEGQSHKFTSNLTE